MDEKYHEQDKQTEKICINITIDENGITEGNCVKLQ